MAPLAGLRSRRLLLRCGIVGPLLFVVAFTLESATRPDYNPWRNMVSELSLSEFGWQQVANFLVTGTLILAFSLGLRGVVPSVWAPRLLTVTGIGLLIAGVFACDPGLAYPAGAPAGLPFIDGSLSNKLHSVGGVTVFFSLPVAMLVLARQLMRESAWRRFGRYSTLSALTGFVFFIASNVTAMHGGPAGLFQRLCIVTYMLWLAALAVRLDAGASLAAAEMPI